MAVVVNNTKIQNASFNGTQLSDIYYNGVHVFPSGYVLKVDVTIKLYEDRGVGTFFAESSGDPLEYSAGYDSLGVALSFESGYTLYDPTGEEVDFETFYVNDSTLYNITSQLRAVGKGSSASANFAGSWENCTRISSINESSSESIWYATLCQSNPSTDYEVGFTAVTLGIEARITSNPYIVVELETESGYVYDTGAEDMSVTIPLQRIGDVVAGYYHTYIPHDVTTTSIYTIPANTRLCGFTYSGTKDVAEPIAQIPTTAQNIILSYAAPSKVTFNEYEETYQVTFDSPAKVSARWGAVYDQFGNGYTGDYTKMPKMIIETGIAGFSQTVASHIDCAISYLREGLSEEDVINSSIILTPYASGVSYRENYSITLSNGISGRATSSQPLNFKGGESGLLATFNLTNVRLYSYLKVITIDTVSARWRNLLTIKASNGVTVASYSSSSDSITVDTIWSLGSLPANSRNKTFSMSGTVLPSKIYTTALITLA